MTEKKQMTIGLVLDDTLDKSDGVQQYVLTIGEWYRTQGHEVHYLVADTQRTDLANVHSLGRFLNLRYNQNNVRTPLPSSRRKIRKLLESIDFDVLHVQLPYSPFLAKQVIRYAKPKTAVVGTFHILPASKLHGLSNHALRIMLGKSLKRFDAVAAVSEPAVRFASRTYGLHAQVIPNTIDTDQFRTGKRLAQYDRRKLNIVFLGRLVKRKGIIELVKAYNALPDDLAQQTRLIICGKGPLRSKAKQLANKDRSVFFTGYVAEREKPNYLATADIAVFPSTGGESFGIVLIEAIASGAGVVLGGNNPGYASVLGEQPYLMFNPTDIPAFSEHLALFIRDEKLRHKMNDWQNQVIDQYDDSVVGSRLLQMYDRALRDRKDVR